MKTLIILLITMLFNCKSSTNIPWNKVEKIIFFEDAIPDFKTQTIENIVSNFKGKEMDFIKSTNYFKNASFHSKTFLWKGGSYFGLIYFENSIIKIEMSSNYGVFKILAGTYKGAYTIINDNELRRDRWIELL